MPRKWKYVRWKMLLKWKLPHWWKLPWDRIFLELWWFRQTIICGNYPRRNFHFVLKGNCFGWKYLNLRFSCSLCLWKSLFSLVFLVKITILALLGGNYLAVLTEISILYSFVRLEVHLCWPLFWFVRRKLPYLRWQIVILYHQFISQELTILFCVLLRIYVDEKWHLKCVAKNCLKLICDICFYIITFMFLSSFFSWSMLRSTPLRRYISNLQKVCSITSWVISLVYIRCTLIDKWDNVF